MWSAIGSTADSGSVFWLSLGLGWGWLLGCGVCCESLVNLILALAMEDKPHERWTHDPFSWKRVLAAQGILVAVLGTMLPLVAYVGSRHAGPAGIIAAGVAFVVCWTPNAASLAIMNLLRDPQQSATAILLSILLRMGLPVALAIMLYQTRHWLLDAGALQMVLAFYLVALIVDTALSLWIVGARRDQVAKVS